MKDSYNNIISSSSNNNNGIKNGININPSPPPKKEPPGIWTPQRPQEDNASKLSHTFFSQASSVWPK
jgi:hypothetical protein